MLDGELSYKVNAGCFPRLFACLRASAKVGSLSSDAGLTVSPLHIDVNR